MLFAMQIYEMDFEMGGGGGWCNIESNYNAVVIFLFLNTTQTHDMINTILKKPHTRYTGWPRKNATPTITNFKEIRDYIKLVSALMSRIFFFQQNDTKINDFDEGILLRQCHFQNLLLLYQKSRLR